MDALAERLSKLPKSVSPKSIFKQMEKIEARRKEAETLLSTLKESQRHVFRKPAELEDFLKFTEKLKEIFIHGNAQIKEKIIKRLIHKIEVNPDEVTLHIIVDQDFYPMGPSNGPHIFLCPKSRTVLLKERGSRSPAQTKKAPKPEGLEALEIFFNFFSSNSLTFGAPGQT